MYGGGDLDFGGEKANNLGFCKRCFKGHPQLCIDILAKKALSRRMAACNIPSMAESPSNFMDWRPLSLNLTRFTSLYIILHSYYGPTFAVYGFGSIALSLRSALVLLSI